MLLEGVGCSWFEHRDVEHGMNGPHGIQLKRSSRELAKMAKGRRSSESELEKKENNRRMLKTRADSWSISQLRIIHISSQVEYQSGRD